MITSEFENVAGPPMLVVPRTSRLFAITDPFAAIKFPRVIISPRAPNAPKDEIVPRTNRLLPVLREPVKRPAPSTSIFPKTFMDPWLYKENPGSVTRRLDVRSGGPTMRVLTYAGPYTAAVDVAVRLSVFR